MGGSAGAGGGTTDQHHRSSSPLKRRASDLEQDQTATTARDSSDDVDMVSVPHSDPPEPIQNPDDVERHTRSVSVDMLGNELRKNAPTVSKADQIPSIDEQIKVVTTLCEADAQKQLQDGNVTYLISKQWLERVKSRSSHAKTAEAVEEVIGPVDNSDIVQEIIEDASGDEFVRLKPGMGEENFQALPEDAWKMIVDWYGLSPGSKPIVRTAHNTNADRTGIPNVIFEYHPLILVIHRLWSSHSTISIPEALKSKPAPIVVVSRSQPYNDLLRSAKKAANIDQTKKVRIWRIPRRLPGAEPSVVAQTTPPSSRNNTPEERKTTIETQDTWKNLLLDVESFVALEKGVDRELIVLPDSSATKNLNGQPTIGFVGLGADETLVLEELVWGDDFVSTYVPKTNNKNLTSVPRSLAQSAPNSGRSSPTPNGPLTRGRTQKSGRTLGCVGLTNLGNTCYMNSALQCLRNVEELTKYFLVDEATKELNYDNPLGNGGNVALAYGALLRDIFKDPAPTSVAPRQFKSTIGRYAPSFSGYGQQDSQEFLGFLLDGLQEDLSRVKKKPYIEKPDSTDDMIGNPEKIRAMANEVWSITKRRDDSVIADLFTGMYKSTLVCPECSKVSITFDPFNNLTLQLPVDSTWNHDIYFFPLNDAPVQIRVDMDKHGSIKGLKEYISRKTGVPIERLIVAEEFKHVFYKLFDDFKPVLEEIGTSDKVCVYELEAVPTNYPSPKKPVKARSFAFGNTDDGDDIPSWEDPMADRLLVPVVHRKPAPESRYSSKPWTSVLAPHFIILTPEEARSSDVIRRKVLQKVAGFSTHSCFREDEDDSSESIDPDIVLTTGSDADSSGGSKVVAHSVDGEDDVVDVTMKDSASPEASKITPPQPAKFRTRTPKWVDPKEFLIPELQNTFEMTYFVGLKELVPVGWNIINDDKTFPSLSTRESLAAEDASSIESQQDSETVSNTSDEDLPQLSFENANTRMTEESGSDSDELGSDSPSAQNLPVRSIAKSGAKVGFRRRQQHPKRIRTYSRKGQNTLPIPIDENDEQAATDGGPLVRLGEGLVIDWNANAFATLFEGDDGDPDRGTDLTEKPQLLPDPDLEAKYKARQNRRKKGITLEDCLDEFGKEEILSEMDTWYCPRCKEHRRASKKFELWKTPDILVMHLKRFSSSGFHRNSKLEIMVDFPIEGLDLTARVVEKEDGKAEIFDLFAVDDHWGGLGGGHYTAFAKSFVDGQWYEYNDSSVSKQRDTSGIVSAGAYLLFYRRRSSVPLGGPRFQEIVDRYDNPQESSSEDEQVHTESGEDQRLVGDSSLRGSSSALTGVAVAPQAVGHSRVLGEAHPHVRATTIAHQDDQPPPYDEVEDIGADGAPLLVPDLELSDATHTVRESVEDDEAIDMGYVSGNTFNSSSLNFNNASWDFAGLPQDTGKMMAPSVTTSEVVDPGSSLASLDDRSDIVQHDSSVGSEQLSQRLKEFEDAVPEANDDSGEFVDQSPVPDMDEDQVDQMDIYSAVAGSSWKSNARKDGDDSEEAAEIHLDESAEVHGD